jgi:glycyl-tRNA synthetase
VGRCFLAIVAEAYDEQMVKAPPPDKLAAVTDALAAFLKSAGKSEKIGAESRDALLERGQAIAAALPDGLAQIETLLGMPGADQIELAKKLRGQAQPVIDEHFRTVLHLKPHLAPIKAAVFPLKRNHSGLVALAQNIRTSLQSNGRMRAVYDDTGAIGKLYRRQDEIGTPFCLTVDFQSLEDRTVTVRDRDTMAQQRVAIGELGAYLEERI